MKMTAIIREDNIQNIFVDLTYEEYEDGDEDKKVVVTKTGVSLDAFRQLLEANTKEKEEFREFPKLPKEIAYSRVSNIKENSFDAIVIYPAEKRAFKYMGEQMLIPFPTVVAYIEVRDGVRRKTTLRCMKKKDIGKPDASLFYYPFGNVGTDGQCCYGNIVVDGLKDVTSAPNVLDMFLFGETNNDLWNQDHTKAKAKSHGEFVEMIRKEDKFPEKWLAPIKGCYYKKTLSDLWKS